MSPWPLLQNEHDCRKLLCLEISKMFTLVCRIYTTQRALAALMTSLPGSYWEQTVNNELIKCSNKFGSNAIRGVVGCIFFSFSLPNGTFLPIGARIIISHMHLPWRLKKKKQSKKTIYLRQKKKERTKKKKKEKTSNIDQVSTYPLTKLGKKKIKNKKKKKTGQEDDIIKK